MASWFIPVLKAVLPHVGTILSAARPVFTKRDNETSAALLQQQISELQTAVSQNAEHIKELAATLQTTVTAIERAATAAEAKSARMRMLAAGALAVSLVAVGLALFAIAGN